MIALLLPCDRTQPARAVSGTFNELRELCGGVYFERVSLGQGLCLLCDEDALVKSPRVPMNTKATALAHMPIYGTVIITADKELE